MDLNIKSDLTEDGILIARIDMPGRAMNVFSLDMMDSLERLLDHVEKNASVRAVVLTSGKPAFIAGADLDMILNIFTERARTDSFDVLHAFCGRLGQLFRRLEKSPKPYVAAINGLALGGGLELCMACHGRVVADEKGVVLGLPEIKLGLLPGAGGTQRLPRLVGAWLGMEMLLKGTSLTPKQAFESGLVDQVVVPSALIDAAVELAASLSSPLAPWDKTGFDFDGAPFDLSSENAYQQIADAFGLQEDQLNHYPAYNAIVGCVVGGYAKAMDEAFRWEMDCFVHLIKNPVAGNMVRTLFINRQRAAKLVPSKLDWGKARVAVLGSGGDEVTRRLAVGKARIVRPDEIGDEDIVVLVNGAEADKGIRVRWIFNTQADEIETDNDADAAVWLSETTAYGCALEVVSPEAGSLAEDAGIVLGRWLRAMVLPTYGKQPLLARLRESQSLAQRGGLSESDELLAVALTAFGAQAEGGIPDAELADVAAVLAGLHPAYTGGPFNYLRQCRPAMVADRAATVASLRPSLFAPSDNSRRQDAEMIHRG